MAGSFASHEVVFAQDATPPPAEQNLEVSTTETTEPSTTSTSSTSTTSTTEVPTTATTEQQNTTTTTAPETGQEPLVCDPETNTSVPTGQVDPTTGNPIYNIYDKKTGKLCGTTVVSPTLTQEPPAEIHGAQVERLPRTGIHLDTLGLAGVSMVAAGGLVLAEAAKRRNAHTPNS